MVANVLVEFEKNFNWRHFLKKNWEHFFQINFNWGHFFFNFGHFFKLGTFFQTGGNGGKCVSGI